MKYSPLKRLASTSPSRRWRGSDWRSLFRGPAISARPLRAEIEARQPGNFVHEPARAWEGGPRDAGLVGVPAVGIVGAPLRCSGAPPPMPAASRCRRRAQSGRNETRRTARRRRAAPWNRCRGARRKLSPPPVYVVGSRPATPLERRERRARPQVPDINRFAPQRSMAPSCGGTVSRRSVVGDPDAEIGGRRSPGAAGSTSRGREAKVAPLRSSHRDRPR